MSQVRNNSCINITFDSYPLPERPHCGEGNRYLSRPFLPEYRLRQMLHNLYGGSHRWTQPQIGCPRSGGVPGSITIQPAPLSSCNRPTLSNLMSSVDTYDEPGFKDGRDMTKNLLTTLYENPQRFHENLESIQRAYERDDAVASFLRSLLDSGPAGAALLKSIPAQDKRTMMEYLGTGNAWSPNKKAVYVTLARELGLDQSIINNQPVSVNTVSMPTGFNDNDTMDFVRRYQGVMS